MSPPRQPQNQHHGGRKAQKQNVTASHHNPQGQRPDPHPRRSSRDLSAHTEDSAPTPSAKEFIRVTNKYALSKDLKDVDPQSLMQSLANFDEDKQMNDLRELVIYNGTERRELSKEWDAWREHRGMTLERMRDVIDFQVYQTRPRYICSNPSEIRRALATYMDVREQALEAGLNLLAVEASKKAPDYFLLCHVGRDRIKLLDVLDIVKESNIWTAAMKTITDSRPSRSTLPPPLPRPPPPMDTSLRPPQTPTRTHLSSPATGNLSKHTPSSTTSLTHPDTTRRVTAPVQADGEEASDLAEQIKLISSIESLLLQPDERVPSWDDIILPPRLKLRIKDSVDGYRLVPRKPRFIHGLLLHGVWGTGKTSTIKSVSRAAKLPLYMVDTASLLSKFQGESQKFIKAVFSHAVEQQPSIIYIDEVDGVCTKQGESETSSNTMQQVRDLMQSLWSRLKANGDKVTVIGSTNHPEKIDSAFLRRFERRFHVPLPDTHLRLRFLKAALFDVLHTLNEEQVGELAKMIPSFSDDDILNCVGEADQDTRLELYDSEYWVESEDGIRVASADEASAFRVDSYYDFTEEQRGRINVSPLSYMGVKKALESHRAVHTDDDVRLHESWSEKFGS